MKNILMMILAFMVTTSTAIARDTVSDYSIDDVMSLETTKNTVGDEISFYFGDQQHGKILKKYGEYRTNKKTNAFNKSDKEACQWVFLSAIKELRDRAVRQGSNAVINIKSNYKNSLTSSNDTFKCGAGAFVAGVALVGDVVEIEK